MDIVFSVQTINNNINNFHYPLNSMFHAKPLPGKQNIGFSGLHPEKISTISEYVSKLSVWKNI